MQKSISSNKKKIHPKFSLNRKKTTRIALFNKEETMNDLVKYFKNISKNEPNIISNSKKSLCTSKINKKNPFKQNGLNKPEDFAISSKLSKKRSYSKKSLNHEQKSLICFNKFQELRKFNDCNIPDFTKKTNNKKNNKSQLKIKKLIFNNSKQNSTKLSNFLYNNSENFKNALNSLSQSYSNNKIINTKENNDPCIKNKLKNVKFKIFEIIREKNKLEEENIKLKNKFRTLESFLINLLKN